MRPVVPRLIFDTMKAETYFNKEQEAEYLFNSSGPFWVTGKSMCRLTEKTLCFYITGTKPGV